VADKPVAEVAVTEELVRALLRDQHPDLADRSLRLVAEGWDNAMWRLGEDLAVRIPRREIAAPLVRHEQRWLPVLATRLPVPIPVPVRTGLPGLDYPWHWSVVPWFAGRHAIDLARRDTGGLVDGLVDFVTHLHAPAPPDPPVNPFRGVPLGTRDAVLRDRLTALPAARRASALTVWEDALAAPVWAGPPLWLHGDLHPGNLVVSDDGALAAVVDFGDICAGDPAVDLAVAWYLFDGEDRAAFIDRVTAASGWDTAMWRRARGWALSFSIAMLTLSDDNPSYQALGERTLTAALAG